MIEQQSFQSLRTGEAFAAGEHSRSVDCGTSVFVPPPADSIEVLEREPQRIYAGMAGRAGWIVAVPFDLLAVRQLPPVGRALIERRHIRGRRGRRRIQEI